MTSLSLLLFYRTRCCDRNDDLVPGVLCFRSLKTELEYQRQADSSFPYYVSCSSLIFLRSSVVNDCPT